MEQKLSLFLDECKMEPSKDGSNVLRHLYPILGREY